MSWFSVFFKKDSVKAILNLGLQILKLIIGDVASRLSTIARQEVSNAEVAGKTGDEKYEAAFKASKKRLPEVRDSALNLAIELAVAALQQSKI